MKKYNLQIGIIGTAGKEEYPKSWKVPTKTYDAAKKIGSLLADKKISLVTGGGKGVMKYAADEIIKKNGIAIGIHPSLKDKNLNNFYNSEIVSGESDSEYSLVLSSNSIIALGGGSGTLAEIVLAYKNNVPVILLKGYGGWVDKIIPLLHEKKYLDERKKVKFYIVKNPEEAVNVAINEAVKRLK